MLAAFLLLVLAPVPQDAPSPADAALAAFAAADPAAQALVLAEIEERVARSEEPGLVKLLKLRDQARRELRVEPFKGARFFDCAEFAPTQAARAFEPAQSMLLEQQLKEIRPGNNDAPFTRRIRYDYAKNCGVDLGQDPAPGDRLSDLLGGYAPGNDVLSAWLESKLDWDASIDKKADYFDHAYCDRDGHCFDSITLFDAYSSQLTLEMPDADVIAYARLILKDNSFHSPIPANTKRQKLYQRTSEGFLEYFKHRTLVEASAWLYVNPDTPLRSDHEGLRNRVLLSIGLDQEDIPKLARRLKTVKDRDGFIAATDLLIEKNGEKIFEPMNALTQARYATRSAIANAAWEILEKHGLLGAPGGG